MQFGLRDAAPEQRRARKVYGWIAGMIGQLTGRMDAGLKQRQRDEQALATLASLVGALVLARAVNDPKLSDDILRATKERLDD